MSGLSKILGGGAAVLGAGLLGSYLFPETMGSLSGGLFGTPSTSGVGPVVDGSSYADLIKGGSGGSIFSNPTVLSSGILAGTSLLGGLFGGQADEEALKQQQALQQQQFDAEMAYKQAALAQALEIAKINAASAGAGSGAAMAGVNAQLKIARNNAIATNAAQKAQALQIPLEAGAVRAPTAQNTGAQSGAFFNNLASILQTPALKRA